MDSCRSADALGLIPTTCNWRPDWVTLTVRELIFTINERRLQPWAA